MRWPTAKLSEICIFDRGLTYTKSDEVNFDGTPVLRANNIDLAKNRLDLSDIRYISSNVVVPNSKRTKKGALLICTASGSKAHLGKVAYIDDAIGWAFGGFMGQITAKPSVDSRYLYYILISEAFRTHLEKRSDGVNINNLKFSDIEDFAVPLPPLTEQQRIVAILDEAFAGIAKATANAERNLANARELLEGFLAAFFQRREPGWRDRQLKDICLRITVGHVGSMANRYTETGIPFLRSQNVRPFQIDLDNVVYIDKTFHSELGKSSLSAGDVAIVRTGYPGTAAVIPENLGIANCSDLVIMRPGPEVQARFLVAFFNSSFGKRLVSGKLVGAAQKHFNVGTAKDTVLHLPSLPDQQAFVERVDELREYVKRLEEIAFSKASLLQSMRQRLLHQAFSGSLTGKEATAA
jgi:type I restriction enzyme S subunit